MMAPEESQAITKIITVNPEGGQKCLPKLGSLKTTNVSLRESLEEKPGDHQSQ